MPNPVDIHVRLAAELVPYAAEVRYVLACMNAHPCTTSIGVRWSLAESDEETAERTLEYAPNGQIPAQSLLFATTLPVFKELLLNRYQHNAHAVYSVEWLQRETNTAFATTHFGETQFSFDWMETLFFHWSRLEEYHLTPTDLDEHGMAKAESLLLSRARLHHTPVVDHLVDAIHRALGFNVPLRNTTWTITHDADHPNFNQSKLQILRFGLGCLLRPKRLHLLPEVWRALSGQHDPYHTEEWMFSTRSDVEKKLYLPSANARHRHDPSLKYTDPRVHKLIALATARGYALGMHPGYTTCSDPELWADEKRRVESVIQAPVHHTRQHFLRFAFPQTCDYIEQQQLKTDSSLGYRTLIGFRCGTGYPYPLYNFMERRAYNWLECPLIMMDIALAREAKFDPAEAQRLLSTFLDLNKSGTHINILFHNSAFFQIRAQGLDLTQMYRSLLENI